MTLDEARRSGLPISVGGSTDPEDTRPDLVDVSAAPVAALYEEEVVVVHGDAPDNTLPEEPPPPAQATGLDDEVDYLLQRIANIEQRVRAKLRLADLHAALDRVDALLK